MHKTQNIFKKESKLIFIYYEKGEFSQLFVIGVRVRVRVLTSCERPPADGSRPLSLGRLSLGELHPETGVLLLLGDESVGKRSSQVHSSQSRNQH